MGVTFNSQPLIPAPLVQINKESIRDERGILTGFNYTFVLNGTIVNVDTTQDSPGASGVSAMRGTLLGQSYIRDMFDVDIGLLEISDPNTSSDKISSYAKPTSITFNEGVWVNRCDYSISLSSKSISGVNDIFNQLESINENWQVSELEDGTYNINHQIQAKGLLYPTSSSGYNSDALSSAKAWVRSRSYYSNNGSLAELVTGSGVMNLTNLINPLAASGYYWNRQSVESVDYLNNSWNLTETFVYSSGGSYKEDYNVTVNYDIDGGNRIAVGINGNVIGFAPNTRQFGTKLLNATNGFNSTVSSNIYTRLTSYVPSGYTLNPSPVSRQVSYEQLAGAVRYNYNYFATFGLGLVSGAIEESIEVNDTPGLDVFASIPVPGRSRGPVIQYMSTYTSPQRNINISATIPPPSSVTISNLKTRYLSKPNTNDIINALKPESGYYYVTQDSEQWNPVRGSYSRNVAWLIDPSGISPGMPTIVHSVP